ncbi:MAG TPA: protein-disulfide reductase DsbD domain-containing protein [Hyphomicrobiaceae bacterium]|nr:protein-disulfide reductase DsbD domain-containing protein [Hyphomicrobiaceae bacterium]
MQAFPLTIFSAGGRLLAGAAVVAAMVAGAGTTQAASNATPWTDGHRSKARLILGSLADGVSGQQLVAGLEIVMDPDWKTYWRSPGDAGGIPPFFDWSKSQNLKSAKVMFPAPERIKDPTGTTIGYKKHVVFPIILEVVDKSKPVGVALQVDFGVCREICVPARAQLAIQVMPNQIRTMPPEIAKALGEIPKVREKIKEGGDRLPYVTAVAARLSGGKPEIVFDVMFPGGIARADVFVEGKEDMFVPVAQPAGRAGDNVLRYRIDLAGHSDRLKFAGQALRVTMVSAAGHSEVEVVVPKP